MLLLYRILAAIGIGAILFGTGYYYGRSGAVDDFEADTAREIKIDLEKSRAAEQKWQESFNLNAKHLVNEINSISADRDRISRRLHNDTGRRAVSKDPGIGCQGSDWRALPSEMGEQVIREIAERDAYRAGLISCYSALDSLK